MLHETQLEVYREIMRDSVSLGLYIGDTKLESWPRIDCLEISVTFILHQWIS
jgi:hypothetical protein